MPLGTRRPSREAAPDTGEAAAPTRRPPRLGAARDWLQVGRRRWVALGLAVALAAAGGVGIGSVLVSTLFGDDEPRRPASSWTRFHDQRVGFSLAYPASWQRLPSHDPQVALIAAQPGGAGSILVRIFPLPFEVNRTTLGVAKTLSERIVSRGRGVKPLAQVKEVKLGGLPAFFYFYSFRDARTGERGIHSHYFAFEGRTMIAMVLQALPVRAFQRLAPTFDQIEGSFRDEAP